MRHPLRTLGALLLVTGALALAACTAAPVDDGGSGTGSGSGGAQLPTGTRGAVDFGAFAIVAGEGDIAVSTWIDLRCPGCRAFEQAAGDGIAELVADGAITYAIHPMTFLDRASAGSEYSSRAASALTCVAAEQPEATLDVLAALYEAQPPEGTEGLTDRELADLVVDAGADAPGVAGCVEDRRYVEWAQASNDAALAAIEGADIPAVTGTPTLVVEGTAFTGNPADGDAVLDFIRSGGAG